MGRIFVLAGTNGAGKSSVGGAYLREQGAAYFNPDEATQAILRANPDMPLAEANERAWKDSVRRLREAIAAGTDYAFETTLGGNTVTRLLAEAVDAGLQLVIWFCGLDSPERHLARIQTRVARGGHNIPEYKVRERYDASRNNLIRLMPLASALRVYDNSAEADPATGHAPTPVLVLAMDHGVVSYPGPTDLAKTPPWVRPLVTKAYRLTESAPPFSPAQQGDLP
ncbi:MAG: AAA family ATPase [Rhodanobacter sp.]